MDKHQASFEDHGQSHPLLPEILSKRFDEHGLAYKSPLHKFIWWRTFENILALLRPSNDDSLLDIGVGYGSDEKIIAQRHPKMELYGIDIAPSKIRGALLNSTPCSVAVATSEELPFPDNSFTRILSREVIEHVLDVSLYLEQIRKVSRPGAIAVITTPNGDSIAFEHVLERTNLYSLINPKSYKDEHMPTKHLENSFRDAGFEMQDKFFDCAGYFLLNALQNNTALGFLAPYLARLLTVLEGRDWLSRLFCDQVKYSLINKKEDDSGESTVDGAKAIDWACPGCKGELVERDESLRCAQCEVAYPFLDGRAPIFFSQSANQLASHDDRDKQDARIRRYRRIANVLLLISYTVVYLPALALGAAAAAAMNRLGLRRSHPEITPCKT